MSEIKVDSLVNQSGDNDSGLDLSTNDVVAIKTADTERCRVDASGNFLVGKTTSNVASVGFEAKSDGAHFMTRDGGEPLKVNRKTSDGYIVVFSKDGTTAGSIGSRASVTSYIILDPRNNGVGITATATGFYPCDNSANAADNVYDWGFPSARFDDIYATNGTIQTSDQNEKQQIASLTAAEITAATAISKLFKTFKWNDKVAAKGDAARTHTGVIAQQVETAMTDAGLDAGDYAFFISSDWYVDADGNEVEADAEGAIAKNRKGIRYPELLAFVGAATEQRLADIETRLTALENA